MCAGTSKILHHLVRVLVSKGFVTLCETTLVTLKFLLMDKENQMLYLDS